MKATAAIYLLLAASHIHLPIALYLPIWTMTLWLKFRHRIVNYCSRYMCCYKLSLTTQWANKQNITITEHTCNYPSLSTTQACSVEIPSITASTNSYTRQHSLFKYQSHRQYATENTSCWTHCATTTYAYILTTHHSSVNAVQCAQSQYAIRNAFACIFTLLVPEPKVSVSDMSCVLANSLSWQQAIPTPIKNNCKWQSTYLHNPSAVALITGEVNYDW